MAVVDLGGHPVYIQGAEVGLDTRETAEDVARTLGCYHRVLCARVFDHRLFGRMTSALARSGFDVPVVNLLSDDAHPCQAVADVLTMREALGPLGRAARWPTSATPTTWRARWPRPRCSRAWRCASRRRRATRSPTDELAALQAFADAAGRGGARAADRRPGPGGQGRRRALHRRLDEHGPGGGAGAAPRRLRRLHDRRRRWSSWRHPTPSCCTACRRTGARRSPTPCSRGRARSCGARPPTGAPPCGGSWPGSVGGR